MPDWADVLAKFGGEFVDNAEHLTAVGLVFLALTALMLLMTIEDAFDDIWRVRGPPPMVKRVLVYWTLIVVGPVFIDLAGARVVVCRHAQPSDTAVRCADWRGDGEVDL